MFKSSKQYLGLGDYQLPQYRAIEKYLHIVLCAHYLLTRQANIALTGNAKKLENTTPIRIGVYKAKLIFQNMIVNDCIEVVFNNKRYENKVKDSWKRSKITIRTKYR